MTISPRPHCKRISKALQFSVRPLNDCHHDKHLTKLYTYPPDELIFMRLFGKDCKELPALGSFSSFDALGEYARNDSMTHYSIALVEDDKPVRDAVRAYLRSELFSVHAYADPSAFLDELSNLPELNCVLLDEQMLPYDGLETFRRMRANGCTAPAIMLTGFATVDLTLDAIDCGFNFLLQKPIRVSELSDRVKSVCKENAEYRVKECLNQQRLSVLDTLSEREVEVLRAIAAGRLNKQIAAQLGVGLRTVETYRNRVLAKIGASSLADAVAFAIAVGLRKQEAGELNAG